MRLRKEQREANAKIQDEKFKRKLKDESDRQIDDLEGMKNKVLEMQIESAYDRGKAFQERLERSGAKEGVLGEMMG